MSSQPQQDPPSQPVGAPVYRPPLQQAQPQQPPQPRPQVIQGAGAPPPRPFIPGGPVGPPPRGVLPPRPSGPNSFAPQQPQQPQQLQQPYNPRPQIQGQPPQAQPYPQSLPPGVRPPIPRPQGPPQPQGLPPQQGYQQPHPQYQQHPQLEKQGSFQQNPQPRPPAPPLGQVPRQGSFASINQQPPQKPNMEGDLKNRGFSIAGSGVPTPLAMQGSKPEEPVNRNPGLSLIREGVQSFDKKESPLNVGLTRLSDDSNKGSRESVRSDISDRPESRLTGSRMTDSLYGSLDTKSNGSPKIYKNDDDDVVIQNNGQLRQNTISPQQRQVNGYKAPENPPNLVRTDSSGFPQQNKPPEPTPRPPSSVSVKREATPDLKRVETPDLKRVETPDLAQRVNNKPTDLGGPIKPQAEKMRKAMSAPKPRREGDNDSGVDESTQGNDINGSPLSPGKKSPSKIPGLKGSGQVSRSGSKSAVPHTPNTPESASKLPMNKIQVGAAPSPNIKAVKSKIGSLENATHKPGGGNIKIENRKLEFKATPRIAAKNDAYQPGGGDKKIPQTKLQWNAKSKIGSLDNAAHKPGGGAKKIESVKLDFKEKAKPKVASTININHKPGGGDVKIEDKKLEIKAQSKIGSLDNVKHRPGGGDIKIFDDKQYLKQVSGGDHTPCESPVPPSSRNQISDENLNRDH